MSEEKEVRKFDKVKGMLVYVCIDKPVKALQDPKKPPKADEWKASVVISDEDEADALEEYASSLKAMISLKKVKTVEFEARYKVAPPANAGKNVWVFTLRKNTMLGNSGEPVPEKYRPRVFERVGNTNVEITHEKLVANGSEGMISIDLFKRNDGSHSLYLKNVLVTNLIEYERGDSGGPAGTEFDDEEVEVESKKEEKPKARAVKPTKTEGQDGAPF